MLDLVTLRRVSNVNGVATGQLIRRVNDTATLFRRHARLPGVVPRIHPTLMSTLGDPSTRHQTRRRLSFVSGRRVSYLNCRSRKCPSELHRYSSTPVLLFCQNGAGLGPHHIIDVMNAHGYASCKHSLYSDFIESLTLRYPSMLVIDKLTCNVSMYTRHTTLGRDLTAMNMLTRNLSQVCPSIRHGVTTQVAAYKKLLARCIDFASPRHRGFLRHGHVITKVSSTALIMRSTAGKKTLMATGVTGDCKHSYFTFPNQAISGTSTNYRHLVHRRRTTLVASTSSFVRTVV